MSRKCGLTCQKEKWTMKSASGNYKLVADYIPVNRQLKCEMPMDLWVKRRWANMPRFPSDGIIFQCRSRAHGQSQGNTLVMDGQALRY